MRYCQEDGHLVHCGWLMAELCDYLRARACSGTERTCRLCGGTMISRCLFKLALAAALISIAAVSQAQNNSFEPGLLDAARQQLAGLYMSRPLPCADPWLAGDDNRITVVPSWAESEGLRAGDVLTAIAGRRIIASEPDSWVKAMRALPSELRSFEVVVTRNGQQVKTLLSCRSHVPYFEAEKRLWTAISRRDWAGCASAAVAVMDAFGKPVSSMAHVRLQCAVVARWEPDRLVRTLYDYASAVIDELPAQAVKDQASRREDVLTTVKLLEGTGATMYANELRARLEAASGAAPPSQPTEAELRASGRKIAAGYGFVPGTPKSALVESWAAQTFSEPLVMSWAETLSRDQDAALMMRQLVTEGMPFLPDLYLKRRTEILLRMLDAATPTQCAQLAGHSRYGTKEQDAVLQTLLPRASETDVGVFFEVVREAMMVRLRQQQFVPYAMSAQESEGLLTAIAEAVPPTERERWLSHLQRVDSLTDAAYCEASKVLYRAILSLTGPNAGRGLRFDFSK